MHNNSKGIYSGEKFFFLRSILLFTILFSSIQLYGQTKQNLEIFYNLADSAAINAAKSLPPGKNNVKIDLGTGSIYSVFNNRVMESFQKSGKNITNGSKIDSSFFEISFTIDKTTVNYGEMFREKLFGDLYTQREISLSGNYILFSPGSTTHNFNYSNTDTVNISEIKSIENNALPFTQGKMPSEPLFSSIYEPIIAVGAAALTVILFFTIRSK